MTRFPIANRVISHPRWSAFHPVGQFRCYSVMAGSGHSRRINPDGNVRFDQQRTWAEL
jgi:hypothetical protein